MTILSVGLALILYSNLYPFVMKWFRLQNSKTNVITYTAMGIVVACIAAVLMRKNGTEGEFVVFGCCIVGAIVRTGYTYFTKAKVAGEK